MANIFKTGTVVTADTTGIISDGKITIQQIVCPLGTTETFSFVSAGQTILNGTCSATAEKVYNFPLGLKLSDLNMVKSGTTQKIYIYLK